VSELAAIVREATRLRGTPYLLATVVRVRGSSYRRPGARMLVAEDRWVAGCVSGGCLEGDVLARGLHRTRSGPVVVTYDSTSDDEIAWRLGCNGVVDVLLERSPDSLLAFASGCIEREELGVVVTSIHPPGARGMLDSRGFQGEERLRALAEKALAGGSQRAFGVDDALVEVIGPPPHLFVVGSGHDAVPLVAQAKALGWTVADTHARFATHSRFAAADRVLVGGPAALREAVDARACPLAVVMTHDFDRDTAFAHALLDSKARYIGVLGPAARTRRMNLSDPRLHAPVGLDLGAETPEQIALSVVSEIQATLANASAQPLRSLRRPIHDPRRVACAVLAAGASRRLGRPKQLALVSGIPLVRHVAERVRASSADAVAVIVGAHAPAVRAVLEGTAVIDNDAWDEGLASSIRSAAAWARATNASALVLTLGDQPRIDAAHVDRLIAAWREGALAAGSAYGDTLGVPAIFDASLFDDLLALRGDRGAGALLRERAAAAIDWPDGAVDVDTPRDVEALATLSARGTD
jgi:xanthine/CO dehydrogenase XdhC/CoxF family maturation factor/CTP:molybdopterin cytidylyltransferase MocA